MELQIQMHEREVQELNESHRSTVDGYEKQVRWELSGRLQKWGRMC